MEFRIGDLVEVTCTDDRKFRGNITDFQAFYFVLDGLGFLFENVKNMEPLW